jgi:hypothetical protein
MKKQQGTGLLNTILGALVITALLYHLFYIPYINNQRINDLRDRYIPLTAEQQAFIKRYAAMETPAISPRGEYSVEQIEDGKVLTTTYTFLDDQTITKEIVLRTLFDENRITGAARYQFQGSVLVFSDIKGDSVLFPEAGEPVAIKSADEIASLSDAGSVILQSPALIERNAAEALERFAGINQIVIVISLVIVSLFLMALTRMRRQLR